MLLPGLQITDMGRKAIECLFWVFIFLLHSCSSDETCEPSLSPYTGKIKALKINLERDVGPQNQSNYTFWYSEENGKLLRISEGEIDVCTFYHVNEDSIYVEWRSKLYAGQIFKLSSFVFEDSVLRMIYGHGPSGEQFLEYIPTYDDFGFIDTLYVPEIFLDRYNISNQNFTYAHGNCVSYEYQFTNYPLPFFTNYTLTNTYTTFPNDNVYVPFQIPYYSPATSGRLERYLHELYLLEIMGIKCIPRNASLMSSSEILGNQFIYGFDSSGRVNYLLSTMNMGTDTIVEAYIDYH